MSSHIESICLHARTSLCLAVAFAFLMSMNNVCAQVTIKERIELQPQVLQTPLRNNATEAVYVAEDSGTFAGTIQLARKYTPIVPGILSITRRGTTFDFNTENYITHYFSAQYEQFPCYNPSIVIPYTAYFSTTYEGEPVLRFFLPDVHVGDTLIFAYQGSMSGPPVVEGLTFYWPDSCYTYFEGALHEREVCSISFGVFYGDIDRFHIISDVDTISHGEATTVRAVAVDVDGGEVQIDSTTLLRYRATPDTLGSFIAANGDTVPSPLTNVRYIDARLGRIKFIANGSAPDSTLRVAIKVVQESDSTKYGADTVFVKPSIIKILLGETKYYYAIEDTNSSIRLRIRESIEPITTPPTVPAQFVVESIVPQETLGVYWEHKYPVWSGNTFAGMDDLPTGVIRLVGRYWRPETTYKIRLIANTTGRTGSVEIEVKKPDSLGLLHTFTKDVFDSVVSIDSICILQGGEYGIPPQLIKGQMREEAPPTSFGGFEGFTPAYRYEPLTHQFLFQGSSEWTGNQAYVNDAGMGTVAIPNHQHVRDIPYPIERHRVWWYLEQHSDLVTPSPQIRMYGRREADGKMNFAVYGGITVQRIYDQYLNMEIQRNPQNESAAIERARQRIIVHLRDRWHGGLNNAWAQTRLASSYGLLQLTFNTAVTGRDIRAMIQIGHPNA